MLRNAGLSRCDLRKLLYDDEISGATDLMLETLLAEPWSITGSDDAVNDFINRQVAGHWTDLIEHAFRASLFGYDVADRIYERGADGLLRVKLIEPRRLELFHMRREGVFYIGDGMTITPGIEHGERMDTAFKMLVTTRRATDANPQGDALLSRLYWPWHFRSHGWKFWARFMERHAQPLLVGRTGGDLTQMSSALAAAINGGTIAVNESDDVTTLNPTSAGEAFERFERRINSRIAKLILGQTLTTDSDGKGSYAQAKVHNEVRKDKLSGHKRLSQGAIQSFINALVVVNKTFQGREIPQFEWHDQRGVDTERATRDKTLYDMGVRFSESYMVRAYDFEADEVRVIDPVTGQEEPGDDEQSGAGAPRAPSGEGAAASVGAAALPDTASAFASRAEQRYQAEVDALAASAANAAELPISAAAIRDAIEASDSADDLIARLAKLASDADSEQFQDLLARAMFAADIIGYGKAAIQQGAK